MFDINFFELDPRPFFKFAKVTFTDFNLIGRQALDYVQCINVCFVVMTTMLLTLTGDIPG